MKKLALLLALVFIVSLFAGCSSGTPAPTEEPAAAAPTEAPEAEAPPPAEEEPEPEEPEEPAYFPLEETKSFSYWFSFPPMFNGLADGPMDYLMYIEAQERLNVEIEWHAFSILGANEQFMLMIGSNDYTDAMCNFSALYTGNVDGAIDDEILIDLTDLIEAYAPEYNAQRTASITREKSSLTSSGRQAIMFGFNDPEGYVPGFGPVIRQDWLDELGLDVPVTIDDYYTTLKAFQSELGVASPYALCADGTRTAGNLNTAYGIAVPTNNNNNTYVQRDGVVTFCLALDEFRDMLDTLHQWYAEGLISPDFTSDTNSLASGIVADDKIGNSEVGIFTANAKNIAYYESMIGGDVNIRGIENARLTEDQVLHVGKMLDASAGNMGISISTQAEDPELIVRFFNWFFTEEGSLLANYGVEHETFEYNEDGAPVFTDLVLNNPDGLTLDAAMCLYGGGTTSGPYVIDHTKYRYIFSEKQIEAGEAWVANCDGAYDLPTNGVTGMMSKEESDEFNSRYTDISTIIAENVLKFIIGDKPLDEFDDFVAQIQSAGIDRCTELAQAAYDRYMAG